MRIIILILGITLFISCGKKKNEYVTVGMNSSQHEVVVKEFLQASGYTYVLVEEASEEYWMAVSKIEVEAGDKMYYETAMEMNDFESKELNKIFDKILFVDFASKEPIKSKPKKEDAISHTQSNMQRLLDSIQISPIDGGLSIAELYENAEKYKNKEVLVRGQVVKVNMDIMDRNWVHIMDGTKAGDKSDLTFTTLEVVKVGDTVNFRGTLALDREFGAGYVYPLIVEGAVLK
jgi:hypothetical protein